VIVLAWILALLSISPFVIGLWHLRFRWKSFPAKSPDQFPKVSILVAARNEEKDLPKLLASLGKLSYPEEKLEFLFANDQSEDQTLEILHQWAEGKENVKIISTEKLEPGQNGKAKALAKLGKLSMGEFLFFTDADCEVPRDWVQSLLAAYKAKTGMVLGITQVAGRSLLGRFQEFDWWMTLGFVKVAADWGIPTTGLGNNMSISQEAYLASGGFEGASKSLTEDLEISRKIRQAGFTISHQVSEKALARTKAEESLPRLLKQRKRWMSGVVTLPWYWQLALGLQFAFYPLISYLILSNWLFGLLFFVLKVLLLAAFIQHFASKTGQSLKRHLLFLFDFYFLPLTLLSILYYFWPSSTEWKSRKYR
jgi:cellulose synthase/poly-beta-1,6-N-acetylglucosamine synthase-like glycosyltransferase